MPGAPARPAIDEMLMIDEGAFCRRCGMACLQPNITERRLISYWRCQFSAVSSSEKRRTSPTPALFTSTDTPPMSAAARATTSIHWSSDRTS